jgi:hypothetical protein
MKNVKFEELSIDEQNFRWALFLESNGYQKELSKNQINEIRLNNPYLNFLKKKFI